MTKVKALRQFTGKINMFVGEVKEIPDDLANELIAVGYVEVFTEPVVPSGAINISENGTYDVTEKASANVNVATQFRNFTYTLAKYEGGEFSNTQDILMWLPTYNDDNQITTFVGTDIEAETFNICESFARPVNKHCKLPVINGKCEVLFIATASVQLTDNASGCSLEVIDDPSGQLEWASVYKLSILEDNANVEVTALV